MDLNNRRQSTNFEDRRGKGSGAKIAGIGGGGAIIVAIIMLLMGRNPSEVIQQVASNQMQTTEEYTPTAQEEEFKTFALQILASTEDVWSAQFKQMGLTYRAPKLILFHGSVQSACGGATSSAGPFYCSADEQVYLDLDFFNEMSRSIGAAGDFACAYVIAHEVGHHVQNLLGTLGKAHAQMAQMSQTDANRVSVQIELQADCFAGVWANHEQAMYASLEEGDLQEAITTAEVIGDDYLQKKGQGYVVPESFNHGTSHQRIKWFKRGWNAGKVTAGNTFAVPYDEL